MGLLQYYTRDRGDENIKEITSHTTQGLREFWGEFRPVWNFFHQLEIAIWGTVKKQAVA